VNEEKRYVYKVSEYGKPEIVRAEVVKETDKMVFLTRREPGFGYRQQVPKSEAHLSPSEAVAAYTAEQEHRIGGLKAEINAIRSRLGQLPGALKRFEEGQE
jgi:UDP-N-acetylenolpyruvoylglucosamine reductase